MASPWESGLKQQMAAQRESSGELAMASPRELTLKQQMASPWESSLQQQMAAQRESSDYVKGDG